MQIISLEKVRFCEGVPDSLVNNVHGFSGNVTGWQSVNQLSLKRW